MTRKLCVAAIGAGGMGVKRPNTRVHGAEVAAVVDVDLARARAAIEGIAGAVAMTSADGAPNNWKLVRTFSGPWELYNLGKDSTELGDVLAENRDVAESLLTDWAQWAGRVGVLAFGRIVELYELRGRAAIEAAG
ncbi:putative kinase [Arthrobacter sp. OAP107]